MDRMQELTAAGAAAGLIDPDMLQIARADLSPTEAVHDLMIRFPGAFGSPQIAHVEQHKLPKRLKQPRPFTAMTQAEREAFIRPPHALLPMPTAVHPMRRG